MDEIMTYIRRKYKESGLTLDETGRRMGYKGTTARQAVWQFLRSEDPRLSMVVKFAHALNIPIMELLEEQRCP